MGENPALDRKESGMKIQTKLLLRSMIRLLVQYLELANTIDEEEFRKLPSLVKSQKNNLKGVFDNSGRGNIFMMVFFLREILEGILNSE